LTGEDDDGTLGGSISEFKASIDAPSSCFVSTASASIRFPMVPKPRIQSKALDMCSLQHVKRNLLRLGEAT
jgi:hypothetical protein